MDAQDCQAAASPEPPGPPARSCVAAWWDMVDRNLRQSPISCGFKETGVKDSSHSELLPES
ncbi:ABHD12B isoform 3 [Pan troglodytes]|uniref:ABHD12B isoform 2 n=1 Tax=Pan troglodytes TaxID=9598 RepID=A0A2J8PH60_PANTR|nr:ABHD12B isoform 2 [Pan troglodytes]PNI83360.1 ABHD12B isoform 3 [Pan troglodytes]